MSSDIEIAQSVKMQRIEEIASKLNIDNKDITVEVPVSTVATTGFAIPPVEAVEVIRIAEAFPLITAAVPPPAIIAKAQVKTGLKSAIVATITTVPATVARGMAIVSNKLSNQGM